MNPRPTAEELLQAAESFALQAGEVTLKHFGRRIPSELKDDGSPVTAADREAERLLRTLIGERFPGHGVLGEEYGEEVGTLPVRWIVDPIDGTRSFVRGVPLFGVLIGVEVEGEPTVGVAHFPALGELVSAGRALGCRWNGNEARVSPVSHLEEAAVLTTDPIAVRSGELLDGWSRLSASAQMERSWGDAYGHALVATGRAEVMVDPILSSWDSAPLLTILEEAGGRFTDIGGRATIHGGSGLSSNGILHDAVLEKLGTAR